MPTKGPFSAGGKRLFLVKSRQGVVQLQSPPCLVSPTGGINFSTQLLGRSRGKSEKGRGAGAVQPWSPSALAQTLSWRQARMLEALRRPDATSVPPSPFLRKGWRGCPTLQAQLGSSLVARGYRSWALAVSMTTAECSVLLGGPPQPSEEGGWVWRSALELHPPRCWSLP